MLPTDPVASRIDCNNLRLRTLHPGGPLMSVPHGYDWRRRTELGATRQFITRSEDQWLGETGLEAGD